MTPDPALFDLEDKGYGRGVGCAILPDGKQIAIHHEQDDLAIALLVEVFQAHNAPPKDVEANDFL